MATVDLQSLIRQNALPGEEAVEIGSVARLQKATAMWLGERSADDASLVYKREVGPLSIGFIPRELQSGGVWHRWWRLEVKIHQDVLSANPDLPLGKAGMSDCVLAIHPYFVRWVGASALKPSSHREHPELPAGLDSLDQLSAYLEGLPHDYWETGDYLTAGFDTLSSTLSDNSNIPSKSSLVIGICQWTHHCDALAKADRVTALIHETEQGRIRFVMQGISDAPLHPEMSAEGNAHMYTAIRQALAGPVERSPAWIDREVVEKVEHIYKLHLNNHNRVLDRRPEQVDDRSVMTAADAQTPETVARALEIAMALRRLAVDQPLVVRLLDAFVSGAVTKEDAMFAAQLTDKEYHRARRQLARLVEQLSDI